MIDRHPPLAGAANGPAQVVAESEMGEPAPARAPAEVADQVRSEPGSGRSDSAG